MKPQVGAISEERQGGPRCPAGGGAPDRCGSADCGESQYLHDTSLYQAIVSTGLGLRLAQGLSLNVTGFYSRVHDQLNLPRGEATDGEIFLRRP